MQSDTFSSPLHLIDRISERVSSLTGEIQRAEDQMKVLRDQGLIRAGIWMKQEKYLYLIHPSDGFGYRKREYVGADPVKIAEVHAGIKRAEQYDEVKRLMESLRQRLNMLVFNLRTAYDSSSLKNGRDW